MYGRDREWGTVAELLQATAEGRGGTLLVEGPPGAGKSLFLAEAAATASGRGFGLAMGRADELGELSPLGPLYSALDELPATPSGGGGQFGDLRDVRLWRVEQLRAQFAGRSRDRPLLVTLDDLHWADPTTLSALWTLRWQLSPCPLTWILARGTAGRGDAVARLFAALERDGAVRLRLEPLAEDAVVGLVSEALGAAPDPGLIALCGGAGGNPALVVALVRGLRDEGALRIEGGRAELVATELPRRVHAIVNDRLGALGQPARQLLETAAVLGRSFSPDDVAELLGEPLAALLPALEQTLASGVLVSAGEQLVFRHGLVWQSVVATLPTPVRQAMHRQIGEVLLDRGSTGLAAAHLLEGVCPGDTRGLAGLDRAITDVLVASPQAAAELAVRTLDLTDPDDPSWLARTVRAVRATADTGRLADAATLADAALGRPLSPLAVAELRCARADLYHLAGDAPAAAGAAEAVLGQEGLSAELRDRAEVTLLDALAGSPDPRRLEELAEAVLAESGGRADAVVVAALTALAVDRWEAGCFGDALRLATAAVDRAETGSEAARRTHPRLTLACLLIDTGRLAEAGAVIDAAREEVDALGHVAWAAGPALLAGRRALAADDLDGAVAAVESALATADALGTQLFTVPAVCVLSQVALRRADLRTAAGHVEGERVRLSSHAATHAPVRLALLRARLAEARDGTRAALPVLTEVYARLPRHAGILVAEPAAAAWLVRLASAAGDRRSAAAVAATADRLARDNPQFPTVSAAADHARGLLDADPVALGRAVAGGVGWARASAAEDLGAVLARAGGEAVRSLEDALGGYERAGAVRDAARVRRRLRRLGVRRRHWTYAERPETGWGSLTDTESSVSVLVAQGWTNRQIADQLFVSVHTVAYHLRRVFRKLDVTSRVDLTRLAVEEGHLREVPDGRISRGAVS
jgi:DNA-binding CsgD family transcriptional regulator